MKIRARQCHGTIDMSVVNKLWDGSMQSMRYLAVLVGQLWGLLAGERTQVGPHSLFLSSWFDL